MGGVQMYGVPKCRGCINIGGIRTPPKSDNPLMTASKVGTSYVKLTIPLRVLPSYLKIEQLCEVTCMEYGLFTAASTLVVRVRSVYAARSVETIMVFHMQLV